MNSVQFARMQNAWKRLIPASERSTVTVMRQIAPLSYQPATATNAWWRDGGTAEAYPTEGATVRALRDWYVPVSEYSYSPYPGDLVVSGGTWTAQSIARVGAKGTWKISCLALSIRTELKDTVSLFRPDPVATADGRRVSTQGTWVFQGLAARLQTVDSFGGLPIQAGGRIGRLINPETIRCYLSTRVVETTGQDVLVHDQTGQRYTVLNVVNPAKIDELCALDLLAI